MSATDLVPVAPAGELETNPVEYMAIVLNRAKSWLAEAASIDEVRDQKAIAVGYESVIREKELAFDAQLSATEIVRRCERRIGELLREGQHEGSIRKPGDIGNGRPVALQRDRELLAPTVAAGVKHPSDVSPLYAMADAPAGEFEQAITEAREEGNLSRANVVRKVKTDREILADRTAALRGERPSTAPAEMTDRQRHTADAARDRVGSALHTLEGISTGLADADMRRATATASPEVVTAWIKMATSSATRLNALARALRAQT